MPPARPRDAQRLLGVVGDARLEDVLHRDAPPAREKPKQGPRKRAAEAVGFSVQKIHGGKYIISAPSTQPLDTMIDDACFRYWEFWGLGEWEKKIATYSP